MFIPRRFAFLLLCASILFGCEADPRLQAKGQIVKGGAPFTVPEDEYVRIVFHPIPADGRRAANTYVAIYDNRDGRFRVVGADGRGLPPGRYRVSVERERKRKDLFKGAYDADRSPFVFDIDSSSKEIVIDLDKKI